MIADLEYDIEFAADESHVFLDGVSWTTYVSMRRDFDRTGQHKRLIYDRGRMLIVSPMPKHEKWKSLIGSFVEAIAEERNIPISTFGQTTWRRRAKRGGLEADECFYIQNEAIVRGRLDISLKRDPPPDLAVEVDLRSFLTYKLAVYARLKISEVWNYDGIEFLMFSLHDGEYRQIPASAALPFLRPEQLKQFLDLYTKLDQNSLLREVRRWAKELP